jgi:hypothetical protein
MTPRPDAKTIAVLTFLITGGFFGVLGWLITHDLPENGRDVVMIMIGTLNTVWIGYATYYVGTTAGSARKTDALERIAGSGNQP